MRKALAVILALAGGPILALAGGAGAKAAEKPTRFWNLTSKTVSDLRLSPAGAGAYGENQCLNDKDKEVDHDERLVVKGVESGVYDLKVGYADGRMCLAKNVKVEKGQVFSVEDRDLDCAK